ncbi:MAG: hypothetical protein NXY57DRAFT_990776 [Lentinula lateritia]|uniref:Uncharacterized protein n=1 Tax=Lentinula lateritia TaxID=40482 RepID=A0ABQ8VJ16_9AGAR|nr:MAG: hypothetical protein NXY57DRAFT_990776 [Lentinula lateritia]KAJ4495625.1 hypothetical protein C8R41DRAFT_827400 [Lentinula lateritia]
MSRPPVLDSFNPFAVHPFTNSACLAPHNKPHNPSETMSEANISPPQVIFPIPQRVSTQNFLSVQNSKPKPVFVPFRKETVSPELYVRHPDRKWN